MSTSSRSRRNASSARTALSVVEQPSIMLVTEPAVRSERSERRAQKRKERSERRADKRAKRAAYKAQKPRSERPRQTRDARAQIKAFLGTVDNVLTAIEKTAWRVRELGDQARSKAQYFADWQARASRLTQTGMVLGRVGGAYRLHTTKAAFISNERAEQERIALHEDSARRLYELSIKHGGAFLKLGQMLSSRPDLMPEAYVRELSKLQDAAPPVPFAQIVAVLERELGKPITSAFASIDAQPVAAASIGQVHRATLHDGRKVAVKVQRPDIDVLVNMDMELLEVFVRALAEGLPPLDFDTIIRETRAMVAAELDYTREAELTAQMSEFFSKHAHMRVPQVVRALSTQRVLVTTFMSGEKITNVLDRLLAQREAGDTDAQTRITTLLAAVLESYARQVLEAGVFQADPHPGNLLADISTQVPVVTVLDFGCAKQLNEAQRADLLALLRATVVRDTAQMAVAMEAMGFATQSGTREGLKGYADAALSQLAVAKSDGGGFHNQLEMISRLADFGKHVESDPIVKLPESFVMLGRVFGTLSGLFVHYQPDMSATARVLPVVFAALANTQKAA